MQVARSSRLINAGGVYAHVFDEFDIAERVSVEDRIEQARRDVSESCPRDADDGVERKPL
jgi:hypothetical protein